MEPNSEEFGEMVYAMAEVPKPVLELVGGDGNAFAIMGKAKRAFRKAKTEKTTVDRYMDDAMSGDYNHLLTVTMEYFDVQ